MKFHRFDDERGIFFRTGARGKTARTKANDMNHGGFAPEDKRRFRRSLSIVSQSSAAKRSSERIGRGKEMGRRFRKFRECNRQEGSDAKGNRWRGGNGGDGGNGGQGGLPDKMKLCRNILVSKIIITLSCSL